MLSRRLLRAIVMQALYAFYQSENDRVDLAERAILERIDKIKSLYIHQISFIIEIIKFARESHEDGKHKHIPSKEDLTPNTRLVDSFIIKQLESNKQFIEGLNTYKVNWTDEKELIRNTYKSIRTSSDYEKYAALEINYENDKDFVIKIFKKYITKNSTLKSIYEERSLYWADDYNFVNIELMKVLKGYTESNTLTFNIYKDKDNFIEDLDFVKELFEKTILHYSEYEEIISGIIKNWEAERIATIDMLLMKMAVCEILIFSEIPVKVSLNEYIEIAKIYSTPRSSIFINGVLDKILTNFKRENKIVKTGRGIIE